ncbi:MAG: hypothetical protein P4L57_11195 [Rhizomicrobium sp.]|nr:hypothetical protein [Rhizomicrobium sp.]
MVIIGASSGPIHAKGGVEFGPLGPFIGAINPFGIVLKQHRRIFVAELSGDVSEVHTRHQAHRRVSMSRVVGAPPPDPQGLQDGIEELLPLLAVAGPRAPIGVCENRRVGAFQESVFLHDRERGHRAVIQVHIPRMMGLGVLDLVAHPGVDDFHHPAPPIDVAPTQSNLLTGSKARVEGELVIGPHDLGCALGHTRDDHLHLIGLERIDVGALVLAVVHFVGRRLLDIAISFGGRKEAPQRDQ